jgi:endonuclease/exonuclease/phosphatase (EEP) superfamily protein YafD
MINGWRRSGRTPCFFDISFVTSIMKIISWNLLRLTGASLNEVISLIAHERPDVLLMQEATRSIDGLADAVGGHYVRHPLPGNAHGHGPATWTRAPAHAAPIALALQEGLLIQRVCQIVDLGDFAVANVHLSHGQVLNRRQLRRIGRALPRHAAVIGDFNLVGPVLVKGFRDVGPRQPTHRAGDLFPLRLDRCLVRGLDCTAARTLAAAPSDHHPIAVTLQRAASLDVAA